METKGYIQQILFYDLGPTGRGFCFWVGSSPCNAEVFTKIIIEVEDSDVNAQRDITGGMMSAVATALAGRLQVIVSHGEGSAVVSQLGVAGFG